MASKNTPRFPDVTVKLSGHDGNTGHIMSRVSQALRSAGYNDVIDEFHLAVFDCESYNDVLRLIMRWVNVK